MHASIYVHSNRRCGGLRRHRSLLRHRFEVVVARTIVSETSTRFLSLATRPHDEQLPWSPCDWSQSTESDQTAWRSCLSFVDEPGRRLLRSGLSSSLWYVCRLAISFSVSRLCLLVANVIVCIIVDSGGFITHFIAYTYNRTTIIVETLSGFTSVHW